MKGSESYRKAFSLAVERFTNQFHILWAYEYSVNIWNSIQRSILPMMKRFGYKSAMFSTIWMWKENCITKERFDIEYGIKNDEKGNKTENNKENNYSVGDDLEAFINRIKNGTISEIGEWSNLNLLCLLDKNERRKLDVKDEAFLKTFQRRNYADVPQEEWIKTEYKHLKFSRSEAYRETNFIDTVVESEDESDEPLDRSSSRPPKFIVKRIKNRKRTKKTEKRQKVEIQTKPGSRSKIRSHNHDRRKK